jgi:Flp pilus assembly protein TadB
VTEGDRDHQSLLWQIMLAFVVVVVVAAWRAPDLWAATLFVAVFGAALGVITVLAFVVRRQERRGMTSP